MKKPITFTAVIFISLLMGGCVGMNSQFNCSVKAKGACVPLDKVNQEATQGAFDDARNKGVLLKDALTKGATPGGYPTFAFTGSPLRYGEAVQRIWIAPYRDVADNYHEPSVLYTVVSPGHWISSPVKSVRDT